MRAFEVVQFFVIFSFADELVENTKTVMEMEPKQIDDFIPLIDAETSTLEAYKCALKTAKINAIGSNHPIYYFSERLNVRVTHGKFPSGVL